MFCQSPVQNLSILILLHTLTDSIDGLEKKVKTFFANAKRLPKQDRDAEHDCIRKEYYKTLEDAGNMTSSCFMILQHQ